MEALTLPLWSGLKDVARQFFMSVREELLKLGCIQCELDPAMFYLKKNERDYLLSC